MAKSSMEKWKSDVETGFTLLGYEDWKNGRTDPYSVTVIYTIHREVIVDAESEEDAIYEVSKDPGGYYGFNFHEEHSASIFDGEMSFTAEPT